MARLFVHSGRLSRRPSDVRPRDHRPRAFIERSWRFHIVMGAALGPFDAWLFLRGLRTLGVRVERHNQNAMMLARFFESHPKIERVNYPGLESHPQHELAREQMSGFTGVMSVELRGSYETANRFIASLNWDLTPRASVFRDRCWSIPRRCGAILEHKRSVLQWRSVRISYGSQSGWKTNEILSTTSRRLLIRFNRKHSLAHRRT